MAGPESDAVGDLECRPPKSLWARVRWGGPPLGNRDGAEGRRRAQPDPAWQKLRLASRVGRRELRRRTHPEAIDAPGPHTRQTVLGPFDRADQPPHLFRQ